MNERYRYRGITTGGGWRHGYISNSTDGKRWYINNSSGRPFAYEVYPDTICQCTGLRDKNGKLIFEHDILSGPLAPDYPEVKIRVVVRWEGCGFVTRQPPYYGQELTDEPSPLDKWDCEHFEVIGNEFDGRELMEE